MRGPACGAATLDDGTAPGTLADRTFIRLREEMIRGDLAPGALVREEDIAERYSVGRTPVGEALQRLRHEGYVTILPRRGTLVSEISITESTVPGRPVQGPAMDASASRPPVSLH